MNKFSSWLLLIFSILFWAFRVILTVIVETKGSWEGFIVFDHSKEIALLFISVISFMFISRRALVGGIVYIITYGYYFGGYILNNLILATMNGEQIEGIVFQNTVVAIIAMILSVGTFVDLSLEKAGKKKYSKTDWFFDDKNTDRKLDERADKNQYKIY